MLYHMLSDYFTKLLFLTCVVYYCCLFRGPWGALSPIPENNALAVNNQVCEFFFSLKSIYCVLMSSGNQYVFKVY